jgi:hypothetical protein
MLNEWVYDARLMEQQVTRLFILFHTDTTFIDRPIDPVASSVETLLPLFGVTHRWLAPSIRLSLVCLSLVCRLFIVRLSVSCALPLALYILKGGVPLQAHRQIVTYDYSVRTNHVNASVNGFFRGCPLFSSKHTHVRVGFFDYRSFW